MNIRFYFPHQNLGCAGLSIGEHFYMDMYIRPYWGIYMRYKRTRVRLIIRKFKLVWEK